MDESKFLGVSVRGWLAVLLTFTICGMSFLGKTVAEPLYTLSTVAIGFYFGQKTTNGKKENAAP